MFFCIILFPNTEGANNPTQRRLQTQTNQHYMYGVSRSTQYFLFSFHALLITCFIRDIWCTSASLVSAPVSAIGLVTPLCVYLHRS